MYINIDTSIATDKREYTVLAMKDLTRYPFGLKVTIRSITMKCTHFSLNNGGFRFLDIRSQNFHISLKSKI